MSDDKTAEHNDPLALRSFGRRRGKPLSAARAALLETHLPALTPDLENPAAFVRPGQDLWLEIGFGGGEHLAAQACAHPEIAFIGCEPFINGVARLASEIDRDNINNIRIWPDDARPLLSGLEEASVGRCYILFPDPWPKVRHNKRRLIEPKLLTALARVLKDGAELRFASDHMDYVRWVLAHLGHHPDFDWQATGPADWRIPPADWTPTRYEQKALKKGDKCVYLVFVRRTRGISHEG